MASRRVALSELRRSTGRVGAVLGLPQIVDHLFDLPELPALAGAGRRLLRPRSPTHPPDGSGAARLLGGEAQRLRGRAGARPRRPSPSAGTGDPNHGGAEGIRRARSHRGRANQRGVAGHLGPPAHRGTAFDQFAALRPIGRTRGLVRPKEPLRRGGRLASGRLLGTRGRGRLVDRPEVDLGP